MVMQFPHFCAVTLLAVIHGATGLDVVAVDHAAHASSLLRSDNNTKDHALLQGVYLPPLFRHTDDIYDLHRKNIAASEGLSDDMLTHIPDDDSCLAFDVGAGVGAFTDQIIEHRPKCKVVAFEAVQDLSSYLKDRLQNNPNVVVVDQAVADHSGSQIMYRSANDKMASSIEKDDKFMKPEKVSSTTLTDYCLSKRITKVSAIRVDVSGGEWRVLRGMHGLVEGNKTIKPIIIATIHTAGTASSQAANQRSGEFQWFFDNGYQQVDSDVLNGDRVVLMPKTPYTAPAPATPDTRLANKPATTSLAVIRVWGITVIMAVALMGGVYFMKKRKTGEQTTSMAS